MKKLFLVIGLSVLLFSCKKDETPSFTATDETGTAIVSGVITKPAFISSNGTEILTNVPASGITISVEINNSALHPLSTTAVGSQVYTGITDGNGNYSISVKTNGNATTTTAAKIIIPNFTGTLDTIVNYSIKTGQHGIFTGNGNTGSALTLSTGVDYVYPTYNYTFTFNGGATVGGSATPTVDGTATITGSVSIPYIKQSTHNPAPYPLANHLVLLDFASDPITGQVKTYSTTTDAKGNYSFTVSTNKTSGGTATIYINDYAATQDTIYANTTVTGKAGVYQHNTLTVPNVYPTYILNSQDFGYINFVQNQ